MPISISDTIDIRYRLQPADLGGNPRSVLVRAVTLQGVETLTPLVHFEGLARPLALDLNQRIQIAEIARSHLLVDWIGLPLVLRPERMKGLETIRLVGTAEQAGGAVPVTSTNWVKQRARRRRLTQVLVVLLLLIAAYLAIAYIETLPTLDSLKGLVVR